MTKTSCKIVCPFCSLLCDDVTVSLDNNRFEVKNNNLSLCKKKIEFFNLDKNNRLTPTINNKTSSLRETISITEKILKKSGSFAANKNKLPICITGDGGLMFNIQELQTLINYKVPELISSILINFMNIKFLLLNYFN